MGLKAEGGAQRFYPIGIIASDQPGLIPIAQGLRQFGHGQVGARQFAVLYITLICHDLDD